jgi:hypothetical protein
VSDGLVEAQTGVSGATDEIQSRRVKRLEETKSFEISINAHDKALNSVKLAKDLIRARSLIQTSDSESSNKDSLLQEDKPVVHSAIQEAKTLLKVTVAEKSGQKASQTPADGTAAPKDADNLLKKDAGIFDDYETLSNVEVSRYLN